MMKVLALALCFTLAFTSACRQAAENKSNPADSVMVASDTALQKQKAVLQYQFFYTIGNLPSPLDIIQTVYNLKLPFNKDLLNPPTNAAQYTTGIQKAVNYGVYGVDMAYTAFYGQSTDMLNYYSATRDLAKKLGVDKTFDELTADFQDNSENPDSLVPVIDRAFAETRKYLQTNHRLEVASHVLAGSVIEAQYLCIGLIKNLNQSDENARLFDFVLHQHKDLKDLIDLFSELKHIPASQKLLNDLEFLQKSFSALNTRADLTHANLEKLFADVAMVRNEMIKV